MERPTEMSLRISAPRQRRWWLSERITTRPVHCPERTITRVASPACWNSRACSVVRVMFSLEMIGYFSDAPGSQRFPSSVLSLFYPTEGNFISVIGKMGAGMLVRKIKKAMAEATSLPVYSINAPRLIPGVDFSDHLSYWREGYPAVMITDTAFYRNANYHTMWDTADRLDYQRMSQAVEAVYAAVINQTL